MPFLRHGVRLILNQQEICLVDFHHANFAVLYVAHAYAHRHETTPTVSDPESRRHLEILVASKNQLVISSYADISQRTGHRR